MNLPLPRFEPRLLAISLVLALLIWAYVDDRRTETKEFLVPLAVELPEGWEPRDPLPQSFHVRLQGPREQIETLRVSDLAVVKRIPEPEKGSDEVQKTLALSEDDIRTPPGVAVLSRRPAAVTVALRRLVPKFVPVRPVTTGEPASGYHVVSKVVDPAWVKVEVPRGILNEGDTVETYPIDISGLAGQVERRVGVKPKRVDGYPIRPESDVWVSVIIEPVPQVRTLEGVPVRVLQGPKAKLRNIRVEPARVDLTIEGAQAEVKAISDRAPLVYVDISDVLDITAEPQGEHTVSLRTQLPPNVVLKSIQPPQVTVTIE